LIFISVKISFHPEGQRHIYTLVETYQGTYEKYYVEYAHIKWGTAPGNVINEPHLGSEHTVLGSRRNLEVCTGHK